MGDTHCHSCGGVITHPRRTSPRLPPPTPPPAPPPRGPFPRTPPTPHRPPPGDLPPPGPAPPRGDRRGRARGRAAPPPPGRGGARRPQHHHEDPPPAVARHAVHRARRLPQDVRDLHQRRVPGGVAVRVVVLLEVIGVRQQHRERAPEAP